MTTAAAGMRIFGRWLRPGPATRVSIGLTALMLTCVFLLDLFFGMLPDPNRTLTEGRERISMQVAENVAGVLGKSDRKLIYQALQGAMREKGVLSAAIVRKEGGLVAEVGGHAKHWQPPPDGSSHIDHVRVPLHVNEQHWGDIQVSFEPATDGSIASWFRQPIIMVSLLLGATAFIAFTLYLRRVLDYLDPSAVIPTRVRTAFDAFTEGVMVVDSAGRSVLTNAAFHGWATRSGTSWDGSKRTQSNRWLAQIFGEDPQTHPWMRAMRQGEPLRGEQMDFPQASGAPIKMAVNCAPIQDSGGKVRGCIVTFNDLSEIERVNAQLRAAMGELEQSAERIEKQNEELRRLATTDPLTGCLNRRAFFERLEDQFAAARNAGKSLACIMTDVDHFKSFNDRFGHAVGDRVLQVVARALSRGLRDTDLLCRYGGEEFCLVLVGTDLQEACDVAERLRADIEARAGKGVRGSEGLVVTSSFGVAVLRPEVRSVADLVDRADKALYQAKEDGRNRVRQASRDS